jgi:Cysteine-rich CPCC
VATVGELFPRFCEELQDLLSAAGRSDLVDQVPTLPVVSRCTCGESNCAHFYTAEPPAGTYGPGHFNVLLDTDSGFVALDVMSETIVAVEVLDRPDVKQILDVAFPLPNADRATRLACPSCGFLTVPGSSYGSYNICELCSWEDDGVQLANPACGGGANRESLIEAQRAALTRYPLTLLESAGIRRSSAWRPLGGADIDRATAERNQEYWLNLAIVEPSETYWLKAPV